MSPLDANHVRHIVSTFAHVDALLQSVERVSSPELSPFAHERPDLAPDEARILRSFVALARTRMLAALDRLGIPRPTHDQSARWSAETTLTFAEIALSELADDGLRGYGRVEDAIASELAALANDLRGIVARARHALHEQDAGGLAAALARTAGPIGEVLREIDRVSRDQGLAEVRPLLAAAAERALSTTFDVGVFGRVSAGKSSLINALVGEVVLPVGATPVTAVPIRLARGAPGAVVRLADDQRREIPLEAIAEYATEERNPENRAGVRAIEVTVPSVPEGLRLLDTPGVGSLASSGPALAFAWLPRCDLGLVLVAAGSAVTREDLALVAGLAQAGIACVVLVSKSDLLSAPEVERAVAYVRRELGAVSGAANSIDVRAVSTAPGAEARLDALRREVLAPLARDHARAARRALVERVRRLVRATAAAASGRSRSAGDRVVRLQQARADAMARLREEVDRIDGAARAVLDDAADALAAAWQRGEDGGAAVRAVIVRAAGDALGAVRAAIDGVRAVARTEPTDGRRVPPLFDPELLDALPAMEPPPIARRFVGRAVAARRLEAIAEPLARALSRYASRLYAWGSGALDELVAASWDAGAERADGALPPELARLDQLLDTAEVNAAMTSAAGGTDGGDGAGAGRSGGDVD